MCEPLGHPSLLVLGFSEAGMVLAADQASIRIDAVISIRGAREHAIDVPTATHRLTLRFDDTESIDWTDPTRAEAAWARQKWSKEMGRPLTPPSIEHARAIIDFARSVAAIDGTILCQCQAGISRSPAAALLCLATWTGQGREQYCIDRLRRIRPAAVPLRDLIAFGDTVLARGGKLLGAAMGARHK